MSVTHNIQSSPKRSRKKSLRPGCNGNTKSGASEALKKKWEDPEYRAKETERLRAMARNPNRRSRVGIPDGMRSAEAEKLWEQAREKAAYIMDRLEKEGVISFKTFTEIEGCSPLVDKETARAYDAMIRAGGPYTDEEMAKSALRQTLAIVFSPLTNEQLRTAAFRTVLEWTRARPVTRTQLTINSAEEWLREVVSDYQATSADQRQRPN
jgi:hypothetical protein